MPRHAVVQRPRALGARPGAGLKTLGTLLLVSRVEIDLYQKPRRIRAKVPPPPCSPLLTLSCCFPHDPPQPGGCSASALLRATQDRRCSCSGSRRSLSSSVACLLIPHLPT